MNLGRVNGISHIMSFSVCDMGNQTLRLVKGLADNLYNVDIAHLIMSADVVNFTDLTLTDN